MRARRSLMTPLKAALLSALLASTGLPALAITPGEALDDPVLEERARSISKTLRCLVCQNQSIDDSNADLAKDLRLLVRERVVAGDTDEEVKAYIVARYGDFVLLKPPFKAKTYALWLGPIAVLALAAAGVLAYYRRQRRRPETAGAPLDPEERRRVEALLRDD